MFARCWHACFCFYHNITVQSPYRRILSILSVLILASFTHPWPRHQYQPPLPSALDFLQMLKKELHSRHFPTATASKDKKGTRSKKDVGLLEIHGLLFAFHAMLESFHCKECDGPSNQCICFWISDQISTRFSRGPNISETFETIQPANHVSLQPWSIHELEKRIQRISICIYISANKWLHLQAPVIMLALWPQVRSLQVNRDFCSMAVLPMAMVGSFSIEAPVDVPLSDHALCLQ